MPKKERNKPKALPSVTAAVICERILIEKDEVITAVRLIDRAAITVPSVFPIDPTTQKPNDFVLLDLLLMVCLKSGEARGEYELRIDLTTPSGRKRKGNPINVTMLGDEHGVNIRAPLPAQIGEEGVHWYEVKVNGKTLTRTPLRISHAQPTTPDEAPPADVSGKKG